MRNYLQKYVAQFAQDWCAREGQPYLWREPIVKFADAHSQIADYWSGVLGKKEIDAYQASRRGGYLHCEMLEGGRIAISGEATLVAISEIVAEL